MKKLIVIACLMLAAPVASARQKFDPSQLEFIDKNLTDRAVKFMETNAKEKKQFFAFLPYASTHFPTMVHPDFQGRSGNGPWADMLTQIDAYTGRLLDSIDDLGIRDNTVFTADNGPEMAHGNNILSLETTSQGGPGPWRGILFTSFEGSLRVPFAIRWPNKIPAGKSSDGIVHEMVLFPTLAKIVGGKVPDDRTIDGIEMKDFFMGKEKKSGRELVIGYMGNDVYAIKPGTPDPYVPPKPTAE